MQSYDDMSFNQSICCVYVDSKFFRQRERYKRVTTLITHMTQIMREHETHDRPLTTILYVESILDGGIRVRGRGEIDAY